VSADDAAVAARKPGMPFNDGQVAQLVEQRTENPRVGGSIPPLATIPVKSGSNRFFGQVEK
jgi:hypothetical protein